VRVNDAYAKPCITSVPLRWNLGGHRSDFPTLNLDEVLYLFHLRFVDRDMLLARQASRNAMMQAAVADQPVVAGSGWAKSEAEIESFLLALQAHGDPADNDFRFGSKRGRMIAGWRQDPESGLWQMGRTYDRTRTFVVPERFRDLL
jgi:hypothetical protein